MQISCLTLGPKVFRVRGNLFSRPLCKKMNFMRAGATHLLCLPSNSGTGLGSESAENKCLWSEKTSEPPTGMIFAACGFSARRQLLVPGNRAWSVRRPPLPHPSARPRGSQLSSLSVDPLPAGRLPTCTCPEGGLAQRSHILINFPAVIREAGSSS